MKPLFHIFLNIFTSFDYFLLLRYYEIGFMLEGVPGIADSVGPTRKDQIHAETPSYVT